MRSNRIDEALYGRKYGHLATHTVDRNYTHSVDDLNSGCSALDTNLDAVGRLHNDGLNYLIGPSNFVHFHKRTSYENNYFKHLHCFICGCGPCTGKCQGIGIPS